jgi:hypothetical protein
MKIQSGRKVWPGGNGRGKGKNMPRHNQQAGRTAAAWARRYAGRRAAMGIYAAALGGVVEEAAVGGPGVPGRTPNRFSVRLPDGRLLSRRQARLALLSATPS